MADKKISELTAASALTGAESVEVVQGGVNKKTTTQEIANLGGGAVDSVNGQTGVVVLDASDVGADPSGSAAAAQAASQPIDSDLTAIAALAPSNDDVIQRKSGAWTNRNMTQLTADITKASQAEMITGTETNKVATPLNVEQKRSILSRSVSNGATGTTNIDCEGRQEVKAIFNTTVTGGITITTSNDSALEVLSIFIPITGANIAITFRSVDRMARRYEVASGDGWYQSTKILQVSSIGTADVHEFCLLKQSTSPTFNLQYDGPTRA